MNKGLALVGAGLGVLGAILLAGRAKAAPVPPPPAPGLANVYGKVTVASTGSPLPGVVVTLDDVEAYTDGNGDYAFIDVQPGSYTAIFSKGGYQQEVKTITLHEGNNELNINLVPIAAPLANLHGQVVDDTTGYAIPGVKVTIDGTVTYTDNNGLYGFVNFAPGSYTVSFSKDGYVTLVR